MTDPVTEFEKYRTEILAKLGNDDPVAVLRSTLEELEQLVRTADPERLRTSPGPGEWSPWQALSHLTDAEAVIGIRVRMIVTQDRPTITGYDQEAWTERLAGLDHDPLETFGRWQALRRNNVRLYESLTEAEWERVGVHSERGEESARLTISLAAGHDRAHLDQIRRGLGA